MFLLQIEISYFQAGGLFGAILGFLLGLIPLVLGIIRKKIKIGVLGLIGATIGNAILGLLLSIPIVAFCIYLILQKPTSEAAAEPEIAANDSEIS